MKSEIVKYHFGQQSCLKKNYESGLRVKEFMNTEVRKKKKLRKKERSG